MSSTFVYKLLLTFQDMDKLAESDKTFNNLLTAVDDFSVNLKFDNNKGITGEIAAGSTYKQLIKLDTSNIVQLGESGTEVRVPADPTNVLGVATKQYVDDTLMLGLIAKLRVTSTSISNADVLNITAVGRLRALSQYSNTAVGAEYPDLTLTVDGTAYAEMVGGAHTTVYLNTDNTPSTATTFVKSATLEQVVVHFKTSLRVQHRKDATGGGGEITTAVIYERT